MTRCRLRRYRDRLAAQIALSEVSRKRRGAAEARIFYCRECRAFHLSR